MAIENYETYTKNILEMIFNNQDIEQLLPYLSKNIKAKLKNIRYNDFKVY